MRRPSRIATRLLVAALIAGSLLAAQSVFAALPEVTVSPPAGPVPGGCGEFTFNGTATDADLDIATSEWDFTYGGPGTFTPEADGLGPVTHTYENVGSRTIALRVTDGDVGDPVTDPPVDDSDEVIVTTTVDVINAGAPTAAISAPAEAQIGQPITFSAAGSTDPDAAPLTYQWDLDGVGGFDPGRTGVTTALPSGYATKGVRTVKVRATDNCGAWDEAVTSVDVDNTAPNAALNVTPNPVRVGESVTFDASDSTDPGNGGSIVEYAWNLDGVSGFEVSGTDPKATKSYSSPGTIVAEVRVTDNDGGTNTAFQVLTIDPLPVFIPNQPPQASFTVAPTRPVEGDQVTFASTSSDPDGPLVSQQWDLDGDGQYGDAQGPVTSTSKLKKGNRTVRLRVTDSRGESATSTKTVAVRAKPLKAAVDVKRSIGFARRAWGIELVTLIVKVPSKTTVKVSCKGRGCPRGAFTKRSKNKAARLRFDKLKGSVRAGAKITVLSMRTGHISAYDTYVVRGKFRAPLLRERCKRPGAKAAQACP